METNKSFIADHSNEKSNEAQTNKNVPSWAAWVEKNAKPKTVPTPKPKKRKLTPWQKRGPMTRRDWVHFYRWASKRALPKRAKPQPPLPEPPREKWQRPAKQISYETLITHMEKLSKPKYVEKPYESEDSDDELTFNPIIKWGCPPHHDKHRPYVPVVLPPEFQHIELEQDFWYEARFPVKPGALTYHPTENIKRLALPKIIYLDRLHCPYPIPEPEYIDPRRKFTRKQWREHKRRLEYLARPVRRPFWCYDY